MPTASKSKLLLVAAAVAGAVLAVALFPRKHSEEALLMDWSQPPPFFLFNFLVWLPHQLRLLADALTPPPLVMFDISMRFEVTMMAYVCQKFTIPDFLATGPKTVEEIALHMQTEYDVLRVERFMYALASHGMTKLDPASPNPKKPRFVNTALSATLRSDGPHSARPFLSLGVEDLISSWLHFPKHFGPDGKDAIAWDFANPDYPTSKGGMWYMHQQRPDREENFGRAMFALEGLGGVAMAKDGPFEKFTRILDIAGSLGHQLHKILDEYPSTKGVLFDQPKVIENAKAVWQSEYSNASDRVKMVGGNFFQTGSLPLAQDGDAYILRFILHDWADEECLMILDNLYDAMRGKNATLIIGEADIPERDEVPVPPVKTKLDMIMMTTFNAKERTPSQWKALMAQGGFDVKHFYPTRSILHWIEAVPLPNFQRKVEAPTA